MKKKEGRTSNGSDSINSHNADNDEHVPASDARADFERTTKDTVPTWTRHGSRDSSPALDKALEDAAAAGAAQIRADVDEETLKGLAKPDGAQELVGSTPAARGLDTEGAELVDVIMLVTEGGARYYFELVVGKPLHVTDGTIELIRVPCTRLQDLRKEARHENEITDQTKLNLRVDINEIQLKRVQGRVTADIDRGSPYDQHFVLPDPDIVLEAVAGFVRSVDAVVRGRMAPDNG